MACAVLEERRVPEPKMELPALDLNKMNEDLEGCGAFLGYESFDSGEELPVRETG